MPQKNACVDVIIVNYRTPDLTLEAVASALAEPETNTVIVVENGSGDDSAIRLRESIQGQPVELVELVENRGFGGGNNAGIEKAKGEYIFLLNSDATVQPGCLSRLVTVLEQGPSVGLVAPAIYLEDGTTLQADAQGSFLRVGDLLTRRSSNTESLTPDWVSGVAVLARREEYVRLGGFNEQLFMYLEDMELCYRYRKAGKTCKRVLDARVIHLGGKSRTSTLKQKDMYFQSQDTYMQLTGFPWLSRVIVRVARFPYYWYGRLFRWQD